METEKISLQTKSANQDKKKKKTASGSETAFFSFSNEVIYSMTAHHKMHIIDTEWEQL